MLGHPLLKDLQCWQPTSLPGDWLSLSLPSERAFFFFSVVGHKSSVILVLVSPLAPLTCIPSSRLGLVTEDSRLGAAVAQLLPELKCWGWGASQIPGRGLCYVPKHPRELLERSLVQFWSPKTGPLLTQPIPRHVFEVTGATGCSSKVV